MKIEPDVIKTYSDALFNLAKNKDIILLICEDVNAMLKIISINPKLCIFLEGPHIDNAEKHDLINTLFKGKINEVLLNLLQILVDNHRTEHLKSILEEYTKKVQIHKNIFPAIVTTSYDLSFTDKLKLKAALEKFTKKQLKITYLIKQEIIGGIVFKFEDTYIDYSLRGGLNLIKQNLDSATLL